MWSLCVHLTIVYACTWECVGFSWMSYKAALNKMQFVLWRWKASNNNNNNNNKRQIRQCVCLGNIMDEMRAERNGKHKRLSKSWRNKRTLIISKRYPQSIWFKEASAAMWAGTEEHTLEGKKVALLRSLTQRPKKFVHIYILCITKAEGLLVYFGWGDVMHRQIVALFIWLHYRKLRKV